MDEVRSWGVQKDYPGKTTRKRMVVHSCGHDLSFPAERLMCQQIPMSQERLFLKKGSCPPLYHRRYFRFLWGESSHLLPVLSKGLTNPSSKTLQLSTLQQLLEMSWHATFTFHYTKPHWIETCVLVSTNTWAFSKYSWSYSAKSTSQPTQLLIFAVIIINYR